MARITTGVMAGAVGELEYILTEPERDPSAAVARTAIVCHPHPLFGGTMNTRIVFHASRTLAEMGLPVLRFNFRGVGRSAGAYDHGRGEQDDLAAALAFLRGRFPAPVVLGGFSFGATVVVKWLAQGAHPEVERALLLGLPVDRGALPTVWAWRGPKLMISGERDEYASLASLEAYFAALAEPKQRAWVPGADHFLAGHMDEFRKLLALNC